ncbi:Transcription factor bHLH84 [Capsicum chinense]|nr:Transcription factor bHLH84 [Capsicum chinense]
MEPMGAFLDEEYSQSLSKMFFTENSSDFMFQLHDDHPYIEGSSFSSPNSHTFNNSNNIDYFSQENSIDSRGSDGRFFLNNNNSTTHEYLQHCNDIESTNFYMMDHKNLENSSFNQDSHDDYVMQEMVSLKEDMGHNVQLDNEILLKRKFDQVELQSVTEDQKLKDSENPKKKSKVSRDHVDISTMLEEAVHYVKFLQIQIKLLSSDDMWMYAPIAYNGMGIDLSNT